MTVSGRCLQNGPLTDSLKQKQIGNSGFKRGFTIIELVVVIVIIGILTTIAVPNMREWAREGQVESKAAEVRNLFEMVRGKATASGSVGYVLGTNNVSIGLDSASFAVANNVTGSPSVLFAFIDVDHNQEFNPDTDEMVAYVDMGKVSVKLDGAFAVLPSGMSGLLSADGPMWYTQLDDTQDFSFNVCLSTGGRDYFNYDFSVSSTGQLSESRKRETTNHCPAPANNAEAG